MSVRQAATAALIRLVRRLPRRPEGPPRRAEAPSALDRMVPVAPTVLAGVPCVRLGTRPAVDDAVLVYLHGGSYVHQAVGLQWRFLAALVRSSGVPAMLVDYALAAERPFPAALDQVLAVIAELRSGGVRRVVLVGDSAGGGLAVAAAERLRDAGADADGLVLLSPWLDVTLADPEATALQPSDVMLSIDRLRAAGLRYAGATDPRDPGVSPLYGAPAGLPPIIMHVGDREVLLPDCTTWAARVAASGGVIEAHVIRGGFHVSPLMGWIPESRRAREQQLAFLGRILAD